MIFIYSSPPLIFHFLQTLLGIESVSHSLSSAKNKELNHTSSRFHASLLFLSLLNLEIVVSL